MVCMVEEWDQDLVKSVIEKIKMDKPFRCCKTCKSYNGENKDCCYGENKCNKLFNEKMKKWENKLESWEVRLLKND